MSQPLTMETVPEPRPTAKSALRPWDAVKKMLSPVASLRVTVVLLLLAAVLVFFGTLAQKELGNETVVYRYFHSWFVLVPVRILFLWNSDLSEKIVFPFPGGYTLGAGLLLNLAAAHLVRFQPSWRKIGIWSIHVGIVLLLVGELLRGTLAVESRMVIEEGKSKHYTEDHREFELAFADPSAPNGEHMIVVPEQLLRKSKGRIRDERLPVDIEVLEYMTNSKLEDPAKAPTANRATRGFGRRHIALAQPPVSGVDQDEADAPSTYVHFYGKDGSDLGVWLVASELKTQVLEVNGTRYELSLRNKRTYKPYTIHLKKFTHELYTGTDKPKDFRSHVRLIDPTTNTDREVEIYMNTPLRYGGETFYQSGFLDPRRHGMTGTILQVVKHPTWELSLPFLPWGISVWQMPYVSCTLVTIGMLIHFGIVLGRYVAKQAGAATTAAAKPAEVQP